ncbi:MAG: DUF177 domain-containing protein [Actinobacteria bacterium]|nr:DUF177 domain-containing protein [Actinomycetota bacterium]MBW3649448.1 DUF177 domain-containing protein [Actinomycetota bacterium]
MKNPFRVNVSMILRSGEVRREVRRAEIADLFVTGSEVPVGTEVEVDLALAPVGQAVEATGTVRARWQGDCRRCLRRVAGSLEGVVREVFEEGHEEGETYPLRHDEIDLEPLARDAVLLELPQAPLCQEDCLGLCPDCGVDRNSGPCSCAPPPDPRWAVLDELRDGD